MILSIAIATIASLLVATTQVIVKLATSRLQPSLVNYFRLLTASLILLPVTLTSLKDLVKVNLGVILMIFYIALAGPTLAWYLYTKALKKGLVTVLHPIANSYPIIAIVLSHIVLRDIIGIKHIIASLLVFTGVILVTKRSESIKFEWKPIALTIIAALLWSSNVVVFKLLTYSLSSLRIAAVRAMTALAIMSPIVLPKIGKVTIKELKFALLAGLIGDVIGFVTWVKAIDLGPLPVVMPIIASAPIFSAILSKFILSEELTKLRIIGIMLASIGVATLSL